MDTTALFFRQNNDIVVTAKYGPEITDGSGQTAEFYYKPDKNTPDSDPSVVVFDSGVFANPDVTGQFMSEFTIPSENNMIPGAYWWRIDVVDAFDTRRTANCGTLLVEAV